MTPFASLSARSFDDIGEEASIMERLAGRRASSTLPALVEKVIRRPLVSAGAISETLGTTAQAALRIVGELGLREMTGRGRFGRWGVSKALMSSLETRFYLLCMSPAFEGGSVLNYRTSSLKLSMGIRNRCRVSHSCRIRSAEEMSRTRECIS
ncbi:MULTISPECIES: helix-turn-helix domain-containing protein [Rhizobium]|uniref:helix-turn-helix domain-containing protein n=1 Tax=Rhizobium TaxID=379 RepID=UPI0009E3402B